MREILFRAYHIKEKEMYLSDCGIEHLGSWFDAHLPGAVADKENVIIEQYTGLLDKNGTKIFEGDKVRYKYAIGYKKAEIEIGTVEYNNGEFWPREASITNSDDTDFEDYFDFEVIGNIHEEA